MLCVITLLISGTFAQTKNQAELDNDTTIQTKKNKLNQTGNTKRTALNLSADQEASFKAASQALRTANQTIEADSALTAQQKKQKRKEARAIFLNELNTFLTPEQLEKVKQFRKKEDE